MERYELPEGWEWTTLGSICERIEQRDPRRTPDTAFNYIDISGLDNRQRRIREVKRFLGAEAPSRARKPVQGNDVLFSTVRTYLRNIAVVPPELDGAMASTGFCVLRASNQWTAHYIFHYLSTDEFIRSVSEKQRGISYPAVTDRDVFEELIPLPPLAEQRRIVARLDALLAQARDSRAALDRIPPLLRRARQAILAAAFRGDLTERDPAAEPADALLARLRAERRARWEDDLRARGKDPAKHAYPEPAAPDTADLPELPEGWAWTTVDEILAEPPTNGRSVQDAPEGFPVLRLSAVRNGRLDWTQTKLGRWTQADATQFLVQEGDFFVVRGNGSIKLVGRGALVEGDPPVVAYPDTLIRVRVNKLACDPSYLSTVWDSQVVRSQIESTAHTTAGIFKISQQHIRGFAFPLPPAQEQRHIVAQVGKLMAQADTIEAAARLARRRLNLAEQALLARAFRGELVPQDPSDEPASDVLARLREAREMASRQSDAKGKRRERKQKQPTADVAAAVQGRLGV